MGAILEAPDAAPFSVEVRSESAYVTTGVEPAQMEGRLRRAWAADRDNLGVLYLPAVLLPAFRAALGAIAAHPGVAGVAGVESSWVVTGQDDDIVIDGPTFLYGLMGGEGTERSAVSTVEIAYADLPTLLAQLDLT